MFRPGLYTCCHRHYLFQKADMYSHLRICLLILERKGQREGGPGREREREREKKREKYTDGWLPVHIRHGERTCNLGIALTRDQICNILVYETLHQTEPLCQGTKKVTFIVRSQLYQYQEICQEFHVIHNADYTENIFKFHLVWVSSCHRIFCEFY